MNDERRRSEPDQPRAETSDYHQAEKLAFENKMLRAVLDSMPDNISIKDLEGRVVKLKTPNAKRANRSESASLKSIR